MTDGPQAAAPLGQARPAALAWLVVRVLGTAFLVADAIDSLVQPVRPEIGAVQIAMNAAAIAMLWVPLVGTVAAFVTLLVGLHIDPRMGDLNLLLVAPLVLIPRLDKRRILLLVGALAGFVVALTLLHPSRYSYDNFVARVVALVASCLLAFATRGFQSQHRAGQQRILELEAENRQIRADERTALARELHDVVAHQLSIISLQIMGHRDADDPEELRTALDRVDEAARSALGELQVLLQVLRDDQPDDAGLERLAEVTAPDAVLQQAARALADNGFRVDTQVAAGVDRLERSVQLTLVRVIQEATTNVLRHAPAGCRVTMSIGLDTKWAVVRIASALPERAGRGRLPGHSMGYGLRGLRERVSLVGGSIEVGPDRGEWTVTARVPRSMSRRNGRGVRGSDTQDETASALTA